MKLTRGKVDINTLRHGSTASSQAQITRVSRTNTKNKEQILSNATPVFLDAKLEGEHKSEMFNEMDFYAIA